MEARFYRFLLSRVLSSVSWQVFIIYYLWYVVVTYNSVFLAGMIATTYLVADLALAYPIGHLIDRSNSMAVNFVASILFGIGFIVPFLGLGLGGIYLGVAVCTAGLTSKGDSFSTIIKRNVPTEQYNTATSFNQGATGVSTLAGVIIGGVSIILLKNYFLVILLSLAILSAILAAPAREKRIDREGNLAKETGQVLRFLGKIAGFVVFGFVINGLFISLEVYSSGLFHVVMDAGPAYYTAFSAAFPLGMIIGSVIVGQKIRSLNKSRSIALMVTAFSPLLIIIGLSRIPLIDIFCAFWIGLLLPTINAPLTVKLTKIVPQEIYGKAMALLRIFVAGSTPVMAAVFSVLAAFFPIDMVLLAIGIIVLPFSMFALRVIRQLMEMEEPKPDTPAAAS